MLRAFNPVKEEVELSVISNLRYEFNYICYNPVRACILHLLIKAVDLNHTMRVEEIAKKVGKRHSVIIYHLDQLGGWGLVTVIKNSNHGNKLRRSVWGLNLKYPNLILEIYTHMLKTFYSVNELDNMCSINRNARI